MLATLDAVDKVLVVGGCICPCFLEGGPSFTFIENAVTISVDHHETGFTIDDVVVVEAMGLHPVGSKVTLQTHEKGKYGRWLGDIKVGNKWLCKELIKNHKVRGLVYDFDFFDIGNPESYKYTKTNFAKIKNQMYCYE